MVWLAKSGFYLVGRIGIRANSSQIRNPASSCIFISSIIFQFLIVCWAIFRCYDPGNILMPITGRITQFRVFFFLLVYYCLFSFLSLIRILDGNSEDALCTNKGNSVFHGCMLSIWTNAINKPNCRFHSTCERLLLKTI